MAMMAAGVAASPSGTLACSPRPPPPGPPPHASGSAAAPPGMEIRVCTNRMCARQGGREVLAAPPPRVDVASCGCLGRCGAGPNVAASVAGRAAVFGLVGTAARAPQLLEHLLCAAEFDAAAGLAALAVREKAEAALEKGNAADAEALFIESIGLNAPGGLHLVYGSSRSLVLCFLIKLQAHLSRGDMLFAMGEYHAAEDAYANALDLDPSIRQSKSFKACLEKLREKPVSVST